MEKLREMDGKVLAICAAVVIGVLGLIGVLVGNTAVGIIMLVLQIGVAFFLIMQIGGAGEDSKNDKYRKLFMNLPIGFAQAKIVTDSTGQVSGYKMVDANETFGVYFNLDRMDYQDRIIGESNIFPVFIKFFGYNKFSCQRCHLFTLILYPIK